MTGLTVLCVFDMPIILVDKVSGDTVKVGSGPGNATALIQDAIDNHASSGDTVFDYAGIYTENIFVDITINLTGEDMDSTIKMDDGSQTVVYIDTVWVNITGFTITNGTFGCMISGSSSHNNTIVCNNISSNNNDGIYMRSFSNNTITGNNISNHTLGIEKLLFIDFFTHRFFIYESVPCNNPLPYSSSPWQIPRCCAN